MGREAVENSIRGEPADITGKHWDGKILLERAQFSEERGKVVPKRAFLVLKPLSACKGLEGPGEPHSVMLQTAAEGVLHADQGGNFAFQENVGGNPETIPQVTARQVARLPMSRHHSG